MCPRAWKDWGDIEPPGSFPFDFAQGQDDNRKAKAEATIIAKQEQQISAVIE
jgi:hypothetical protein